MQAASSASSKGDLKAHSQLKPNAARHNKRKVSDLTQDDAYNETSPQKKGKMKTKPEPEPSEKRLRRFRPKAPQSFLEVHARAMTQRMTILDRSRSHFADGTLNETVKIAGTTGNVYTVIIGKVPSCDCPHARKGNQCKHIVYVVARALKARHELQYQLAFLNDELQEMFDNAPLPQEDRDSKADKENDGRRKPIAEDDDCPICCVEFVDSSKDEIVYCKAACGNNVHRSCFNTWAQQKRSSGDVVTCPFCRTPWEADEGDVGTLLKGITGGQAKIGAEGYVNIASELGLSGRRNYSSYHQFWVNRERRYGRIDDDAD